MSRLCRHTVCQSFPQNPKQIWMRGQCANWLMKLLEFQPSLSDHFFVCFDWVTGDLSSAITAMKKSLKLPANRTKAMANAREAIKELVPHGSRHMLANVMESFYDSHPLIQSALNDFFISYLQDWWDAYKDEAKTIFPRGFKSLFNLDDESLALCAYAWGLGSCRPMEAYFEDDLSLNTMEKSPTLAYMLGISSGQLTIKREKLSQLGILDSAYDEMMRVSSPINSVLTMGQLDKIQNFFCKRLPVIDVPLEQFQIGEDEKKHAIKLLRQKNSAPAHLLLYGPPGTGKTSFASQLVKHLKVQAWSVNCNERDSSKDRRVSLLACINLSLLRPGSIVVVDEAERMLDTDIDETGSSSKAWLNDLLEKKNLKIIWITNKIDHIDQAVRRRFSFSILFPSLGVKESKQMWTNVARRLNVCQRFPESKREYFAKTYPVPVAVMENVARQAKSLAPKNDFCTCAELILKSHMQLSSNGFWENNEKSSPTKFQPEAICTSVPASQLISRLKTLREKILASSLPGMGNILFYGPPGTGKTAFGHYLAEELEMECITERASNILGPFVGETERRIAEIFNRAHQQDALLLIDEVDSFLASREHAQRSWEQTMVNEFLTALESFSGMCVCTTNFQANIDGAAIRRFPFKVEFCYATKERALLLFNNILAPLTTERLSSEHLERLEALKFLTPGDFRSVLSQFWLEDPKDVSCSQLLDALAKEQKMKPASVIRNIGFNL